MVPSAPVPPATIIPSFVPGPEVHSRFEVYIIITVKIEWSVNIVNTTFIIHQQSSHPDHQLSGDKKPHKAKKVDKSLADFTF